MNIDNKTDITCKLEELENAEKFNSKETNHSILIAYLLFNEHEFLEKFFDKIGLKTLNSTKDLIIQTEAKHIDILIKNEKSVVAIENKFKDRNREKENKTNSEHKQLKRYEEYIEEKYQNVEKKFVYLRPFLHELDEDCKNWQTFTYKDILNILNSLKTNSELINRYKKIIEKIYEPQAICISILKEILNLNDITDSNIDDNRGDINGYAIEIPLNKEYESFLQIEHFDAIESRGKLTINLVVKTSAKTHKDEKLFNLVGNGTGNNEYEWVQEKICDNKEFSKEIVRDKILNSRIINILKQNNIF